MDIIKRDESKLHKVPTKVITTMPIFIFVMLIAIIVGIVFAVKQNFSVMCIWFAVALICYAWGKFVDLYFNFQENYAIAFETNCVKITYDLDNQLLSGKNNKASITIKDITKIKSTPKYVMVFGDIVKKQPHQKPKTLKNYKIYLKGFDEHANIQDRLTQYHNN